MKPMANYMPPEQFNQVIDAIPRLHIRKWKDEDIQMLFKLCYWCGLRISEAMKLSVEDAYRILQETTKKEITINNLMELFYEQ